MLIFSNNICLALVKCQCVTNIIRKNLKTGLFVGRTLHRPSHTSKISQHECDNALGIQLRRNSAAKGQELIEDKQRKTKKERSEEEKHKARKKQKKQQKQKDKQKSKATEEQADETKQID